MEAGNSLYRARAYAIAEGDEGGLWFQSLTLLTISSNYILRLATPTPTMDDPASRLGFCRSNGRSPRTPQARSQTPGSERPGLGWHWQIHIFPRVW